MADIEMSYSDMGKIITEISEILSREGVTNYTENEIGDCFLRIVGPTQVHYSINAYDEENEQ